MEEEIAYLSEGMGQDYNDLMRLPYSRRQRLVEWKEGRDREQQQEMDSARRTRAR
jgi:hypothetical protein